MWQVIDRPNFEANAEAAAPEVDWDGSQTRARGIDIVIDMYKLYKFHVADLFGIFTYILFGLLPVKMIKHVVSCL